MLYRMYYVSRRTDQVFARDDIEASDDAAAILKARDLAIEKDARFEVWDERRLVHRE
jgi:hypothetical protein